MKTKILLFTILSFICCTVIAADTGIRSAERELKKTQKEVSTLVSKKQALEAKLQKAKAEHQEASAKVKELKKQSNSPAYKRAAKRAEMAQKKVADFTASLNTINAELKVKETELKTCQKKLSAARQNSEEDEYYEDDDEEDDEEEEDEEEDDRPIQKKAVSDNLDKPTKENKGYPGWMMIVMLIVGAVLGWFVAVIKPHCRSFFEPKL